MATVRRRILVVLLAVFASVGSARAAIRYVKPAASGAGDGTSWSNAYGSLQTALGAATSGDEIWVAAGTYKPTSTTDRTVAFILKNGVGIYGGFGGTEGSRGERNVSVNVTTLSGEIGTAAPADNSYHVVEDGGSNATAVLDGFTITGSYADGSFPYGQGGGLYVTGGPTIANCRFIANFAQGGVVLGNGGSLNFTNCTFLLNTVHYYTVLASAGSLTCTGCTFDRNTATQSGSTGGGAAVFNGTATLTNCVFHGNRAQTGGGLYLYGTNATIRDVVFTGNIATTPSGSPVGGAMAVQNGGTITIANALFAGNQAPGGAAIYNGSGTSTTITNATFKNNVATTAGIVCQDSSNLTIRNSIVWGNTGSIYCGTAPAITYSDVEGGFTGAGNVNANPLFRNASHPGNAHLGSGSPAIDAGDNTAVPGGVTTDLDGAARFVDDPSTADSGVGPAPIVDMGAYEFAGAPAGYNLSVALAGGGTGSITSAPAGIDCGPTCSANFASGTLVTLTPVADPGMVFSGWSGDCSSTGACSVTMSAARSVTASFSQRRFVLIGATGANDGTSWANAYTSLADALAAASSGSELWVAAGTYTPGASRSSTFTLKNGVAIYGGFDGAETARDQRDLVANRTILSGEIGAAGTSDNCYHVVTADSGITNSTVLDGLVITGGNANGSGFDACGGGVVSQGSPLIRSCTFVDNAASTTGACGGGGVFSTGTATIVASSLFASNSSTYGSGAMIPGGATIADCTFAANLTGPPITANGGLIPLNVVNTIVWGNNAGTVTTPGGGTPAPSVSYSVVEGGYAGTANLNLDPLFIDAGVRDFRLGAGSPAINAGSNAGIPSGITTDADGFARIVNTSVDIGAYERGNDRVIVSKYGGGSGTVSSAPAGIDCGATCSATPSGALTLTASASVGWHFNGWGGACSGVGTCVVSAPSSVTARFGRLWYVNAFATGTNSGTNWTDAFVDLQSALTAASAGDEIWVAAAVYKPGTGNRDATFSLKSGVAIYGGFLGTETLRTQRNAVTNVTTLDGDNVYNVVFASNVDAGAVLDGFTITGGNANSSNFNDRRSTGGGIYIETSRAQIVGCTITGNSGYYTGGVHLAGTGSPSLTGCRIDGNNVTNGFGGGIRFYFTSGATLTRCTFTGNTGSVSVLAAEGSSFRVNDCDIVQNTATFAPLYFYNNPGVQVTMVFTNTLFRDNTGPTASAVYTQQSSPQFINCTFTRNTGSAALRSDGTPTAMLTNCILWGDSSEVSGSPSITYSDVQGGFSGAGNINADPLFLNAIGGNLRLGSNSPAIDAGSNIAATSIATDYEGKPRKLDAPRADTGVGTPPLVDMGAYEFYPVTASAPSNASACIGGSAAFSTTAGGWGALTYQWRKATNPIDGATASTYTIDPVGAGSGGSYDVVVTDSIGTSTTSAAATMTVILAPSISQHPANVTVCRNQPVQFSVTATGSGLTYQWRRNEVPIDNATSSTYSIASVLASQAGSYDVVIGSACAAPVTSNVATLVVRTPPEIDVPPSNQTVCHGQQVQLSIGVTGTNVGYQWRKGGQNIDGATAPTYTIPSATSAHAGNYDVVLTGTCGTLTSGIAVVTVNTQPSIASFSPLSGNSGTQVVISGAGLTGTMSVTFNGASATFNVDNDGQITSTVPAGANSGPISISKSGCALATSSGGFTVIGGFGAPAGLLATATSTTQIFVSWLAVSGAHHYELWRRVAGGGFSLFAQPLGNAFADGSCGTGATCVYQVRAVDAVGTMSAFSAADLATTMFFTDGPLAAGITTIKAVHWTELRTAVNLVRAAGGLAPATFTDPLTTPRAVHLLELRAALDAGRAGAGVGAVVYGEGVGAGSTIRAAHLTEIRNGVK